MAAYSYTVSHLSSIDCYKRAETSTHVLYSGSDPMAAYSHAVNSWVSMWHERMEDLEEDDFSGIEDIELLSLLQKSADDVTNVENMQAIHSHFSNRAFEIWSPEYINSPVEEIVISMTDEERGVDVFSTLTGAINFINNINNEEIEFE